MAKRAWRLIGQIHALRRDMWRSDLATGFKALKYYDAVIGPAKDGGFYLIGLNAPADPELFDGIRWSHKDTGKNMCAAIDGWIAFLRTLEDVDDLISYKTNNKFKLDAD